jgi:hypothetical protein
MLALFLVRSFSICCSLEGPVPGGLGELECSARRGSDNAWGGVTPQEPIPMLTSTNRSRQSMIWGGVICSLDTALFGIRSLVRVEPEPEPITPEMVSRRQCGFRLESGE